MRYKTYLLILLILFFTPFQGMAKEKNSVIVCENGLEMFGWDLEFVRHAEHSIDALVCFFGGSTARALLTEIEARLEEVPTLQVHVLASPVFIEPADWELIYHLQKRFPNNFHLELCSQIVKLLPDLVTIDNHIKMFIVDETYFSAGGTNLEERHCAEGTYTPDINDQHEGELKERLLPAGMRDQDVVGRGPIAKELRTAFFELYSLWEYYNQTSLLKVDPQTFQSNLYYFEVPSHPYVERFEHSDRVRDLDDKQIKMIVGGPHQKKNAITQEYIRLIQKARHEIILSHFYFFPSDPILKALMEAVNRGVKLTVITNGLSDDSPESAKFFAWANRVSYVPIFYGNTYHFWDAVRVAKFPVRNTQIYEYHVPNVFLHKKSMLVDHNIFVVGSYNMSMKSALGDYELILVIDSEEVNQDARRIHAVDLQYSKPVTPVEARRWYFDPVISYWGEMQKRFSGFL